MVDKEMAAIRGHWRGHMRVRRIEVRTRGGAGQEPRGASLREGPPASAGQR